MTKLKIARKFVLSLTYLFLYSMVSVQVNAEQVFSPLLSELKIKGELIQGSALIGQAKPGSLLSLNDKQIKQTPDGQFFIGFGRDAKLEQTLRYQPSNNDSIIEDSFILKKRVYNLQEVNGVPHKTVTPSKKHLKRIREESALVSKARAKTTKQTAFLQPFKAPMDSRITGVYGSQRIFNGVPKRPHFGVDYAGPIGALVYAPADGNVTLAHKDMFYSGGTLVVDHGYGVSSSFLHLSELLVKEGDKIKQGQVIAKVGKGGRATGPHLDWRMNWYNVRIDPLKVIAIH